MAGYLCVTHTMTHRPEAERLCRALGRYGFRFRCISEETTASAREEQLASAVALIAVTGIDDSTRGFDSLSADIDRCLGRVPVLLLSLQENPLDDRYSGGAGERAVLIPYTVGRMPDRHSVALFLHRLFVRHLAALPGCFHPERCVDDGYGRVVRLAVNAHRGEGGACYALGRAYERGERVPAIEHEAALWITRAAEIGVPDARIHMGELHLLGRCRHPDPAEAYRLFSLSADAGDVRGYYHRGLCALFGLGVDPNVEAAMSDLSVAACAGYAPALYQLGCLYRDGLGIKHGSDFHAALHCFYAACRRGMPATDTDTTVGTGATLPADAAIWTPTGATTPWTPTAQYGETPLSWTPVTPRPGAAVPVWHPRIGRRTSSDCLVEQAMAAGVATPERAMTEDGHPLPPPPALYRRRAGRHPRCITMRQMRRTRLWALANRSRCAENASSTVALADAYPGKAVAGYAPPELRAREALAARCFSRAHIRTEARSAGCDLTDPTVALFGARTILPITIPSGRPKAPDATDSHGTYIDRAAFDVADAALALGRLLETGDPASDIAPHPTRALVWYRYAALGGSAEAFCRLGDAYRRGAGVPADSHRAAVLYQLSADRGDMRGQFARAVVCERGIGTDRDPTEAFRRYEQAASADYAPAQNNLGGCYEHGIGVVPDELAAVEWYTRAAAAGQTDAICRLGLCCECGRGMAIDLTRALHLYETAARRGHPYALYRLGLCYERGLIERRGTNVSRSSGSAMYSTAERSASATAMVTSAVPVAPIGYIGDAVPLVAHAFEVTGVVGATVAAHPTDAVSIPNGAVVILPPPPIPEALRPMPHYAEAVYLWEEAAKRGLPAAAYALSICYDTGRGVCIDTVAATRWLTLAAEGGHIQALYRLGLACLEGHGRTPDSVYARQCFTRAATRWEARRAVARRLSDAEETDALPVGALTPESAAAGALYMRGYCTLYAIGEESTASVNDHTGRPTEPSVAPPDSARLTHAVADLRRAAALGHVGALTALGDLYTYGLLKPAPRTESSGETTDLATARAADEALELYAEAARVGMARVFTDAAPHSVAHASSDDGLLRDDTFRDNTGRTTLPRAVALRGSDPLADEPLHALITVAERTAEWALACEAEGDAGDAELARVQVWRSLAGAAELGSADALVAMAACSFFGHGTPENRTTALRFLERAEAMGDGRVIASLWIGDIHRCGWCGDADAARADEAYLRALCTPLVSSECGAYILAHRREARRNADLRARAEVLYRLATLQAVAFTDDPSCGDAFHYLVEAILAGHTDAENDLARMYARELGLVPATRSDEAAPVPAPVPHAPLHGRHHREPDIPRTHRDWMTDYYTALAPVPEPFRYALKSTADPDTLPPYVTAPVSDDWRIRALNYLGDCFFDGRGVTPNAVAAVTCYRRVVSMKLTLERGQQPPESLAWAQYSLGWCLLRGVGCARDDREAVLWLTKAARSHAEAAYSLADCYARGVGVDVPDDREAIKFYRKALKLGCVRAQEKLSELEDRLRESAKT